MYPQGSQNVPIEPKPTRCYQSWGQNAAIQKDFTVSDQKTISVPEAGRRYFGLSRNGAYAAAERGEIPTIKIGRLLKVPVKALEQMLENAKPGKINVKP
jgi:helix-turn-helix protein